MKQTSWLVLILLLATGSLEAQIESVALKSAANSLKTFKSDSTRTRKLLDAKTAIDLAIKDSAVTATTYFWLTRAEIYKNIAYELSKRRKRRAGDSLLLPPLKENPAYQSFKAYMQAYGRAGEDVEDAKQAKSGIEETTLSLNGEGQLAFNAGKYNQAYELYKGVLDGKQLLKPQDTTGLTDQKNQLVDQEYLTALSAYKAGMNKEADTLFRKLYNVNYKNPVVYQSLYLLETAEEDVDINPAYIYIERGRELIPDDPVLLEMQIMHLKKTDQFEALIDVLLSALEKDPENLDLEQTLGFAYDQLFQRAVSSNDRKTALELFDKAKRSYKRVLEAHPDNFDVQFWMGELHSNRSTLATRYLVELSSDFSEEGMKKYDEIKKRVYGYLDEALPYLQKAESLQPNDTGTLIALREVFARLDNEEMEAEFKNRLQTIMSGGRNEAYFKN